jgi:hypothetical protein
MAEEDTMEISTPSDPARFARAIRDLARDAPRTMTHSPSAASPRRLSRRIDVLAAVLVHLRGGKLAAWLDSLRREVRAAAVHRTRASGLIRICVEIGYRSVSRRPRMGGAMSNRVQRILLLAAFLAPGVPAGRRAQAQEAKASSMA